jgi:hypothetical protein
VIPASLRRALLEGRWEYTEAGILFPRERRTLEGWATVRTQRRTSRVHNRICSEGLLLIATDAYPANLYMTLFGNNLPIDTLWTGANFAAIAGELDGSEGYTEATRQSVDVTGFTVSTFHINTAAPPLYVWGIGVLTTNTKGDTAGQLFSAINLAGITDMYDGDELDVNYSIAVGVALL